ncbi:likePyrABCN [Fonticula alba]|uniref:Carbamoyl phosphate synthase arginine-specific large chain n=1 Tax=Fonticula alba TaxID=691883 RepID=A0A058ZF76_FONAL|nr:likePyrABCN [Fonticula alba]KCV72588.1 likePyrABCN [Fonticula alba]|eukprot:XP_009492289.1 likePyrABCN [Fonticula alba]
MTAPEYTFPGAEAFLESNAPALTVDDEQDALPLALLVLSDGGTPLVGRSFGAAAGATGLATVLAGPVGHIESITDPSHGGHVLVLTHPMPGAAGVPSASYEADANGLARHRESARARATAVVVGSDAGAGADYSHWRAADSLGAWLAREGVPAICGVDTRALTRRISRFTGPGHLWARILIGEEAARVAAELRASGPAAVVAGMTWGAPFTGRNLVAEASIKAPRLFRPTGPVARAGASSPSTAAPATDGKRPLRVLALDMGLKHAQIRALTNRGAEVVVVPWNFDILTALGLEDPAGPAGAWVPDALAAPAPVVAPGSDASFGIDAAGEAAPSTVGPVDAVLVTSGPVDPSSAGFSASEHPCAGTIARLAVLLARWPKPVFGIGLGHHLLALAAGGSLTALAQARRAPNVPSRDPLTQRCYITAQNHGVAVDFESLEASGAWDQLFANANDHTCEGVASRSRPHFSVQFHPEGRPGPSDTDFLFDRFLEAARDLLDISSLGGEDRPMRPLAAPSPAAANAAVPARLRPRKILLLGSGGLSIGQAGEFDYSGSQAIKAFKEEGIRVILINPNIATVQTSRGLADKVYFLPINAEYVRKVIEYERPDGISVSFGGQTALNVGIELHQELKELGVQVLGTPIETVILTEDRELFAKAMEEIGESCAESSPATSMEEAIDAANRIGYPLIVRAAFALGGLGSGFAHTEAELVDLCTKAFAVAPQVLIERSMQGWKEIEYEVVRDCADNCVTVCNMENVDPLGVHTGDSIVVAPTMTLTDADNRRLRSTALSVVRHLGVVGECNIQYAVNPATDEYCIIEVNARLSRSSALASKATGYPLAFVAAKLALNIPLPEIVNRVTETPTTLCFEPALDYCVVKVPRWDLRKFTRVSNRIASAMKSVGEVMAIGRTFEEALQKAIRAVDNSFHGFEANTVLEASDENIGIPTDARLFALANGLHAGYSIERIWELTKIDRWFLSKMARIVAADKALQALAAGAGAAETPADISPMHLRRAKQLGFSDGQIARALRSTEMAVRRRRLDCGVRPFVKQIDTVAGLDGSRANYFYLTYHATEDDVAFEDRGIIVLGSGVYRIGSSVEFDWCAVRCIRTLRETGFRTVMINYNPETVSTDYDEADRLYFENITTETVMDVYDLQSSQGVVISMGGQTPNLIALGLHRQGVRVLGTSPESIDCAENRYKFSRMLDKIDVDQPAWRELASFDDARSFCRAVTYPVLVRPSYVLSGAAMNVVFTEADLESYLGKAASISPEHPVVVTKFIEGAKEIEVNAVGRGGELIMHVVSEHVENAGVHSGDATLVLPPQDLDQETTDKIVQATGLICRELHITGPFNIQFIAKDRRIQVIECNLRASRSMPFDSKVTGVDLIEMATRAMVGLPVTAYPAPTPTPGSGSGPVVAVKVPQFSFSRLSGADPVLGVEMASTGEVACFGRTHHEAYLKALEATGFRLPARNVLISIGSYAEKSELLPAIRKLATLGYRLFATPGTADFLASNGVEVGFLEQISEDSAPAPAPAAGGGGSSANSPPISPSSSSSNLAALAASGTAGTSTPRRDEYSLANALASKQIDLYINLPSKNSFRRPANYVSAGYLSRRLAVDFSVPLITNVKCAKLFIDALAKADRRALPVVLDGSGDSLAATRPVRVGACDVLSSAETALMPALVDLALAPPASAGMPATVTEAAARVGAYAEASLRSGLGFVGIDLGALPEELGAGLAGALAATETPLPVDHGLVGALGAGLAAAAAAPLLAAVLRQPFPTTADALARAQKLLQQGADGRALVLAASGPELGAWLLLAAGVCRRPVHVTGVASVADLRLIAATRAAGVATVTCDVSAEDLFFGPEAGDLWKNIALVDVIQPGSSPFADVSSTPGPSRPAGAEADADHGQSTTEYHPQEHFLPLLLTAVHEGLLTLEEVIAKCCHNPARIVGLPGTAATMAVGSAPAAPLTGWQAASPTGLLLEVELDRAGVAGAGALPTLNGRSPANVLKSGVLRGQVARVFTQLPEHSRVRSGLSSAGTLVLDGAALSGRRHVGTLRTAVLAAASRADGLGVDAPAGAGTPAGLGKKHGTDAPAGAHADLLPAVATSEQQSQQQQPPPQSQQPGHHSAVVTEAAPGEELPAPAPAPASAPVVLAGAGVVPPASCPAAPSAAKTALASRHVLAVGTWNRSALHRLFELAQDMRKLVERGPTGALAGAEQALRGRVLCTVFYEPSTRTSASFEAAMLRQGGSVVSIPVERSSVQKGESLADTVRTLDSYADAIVLRHPGAGAVAEAAATVARAPVINAGDGIGEHPTQAFLDLFTIREELGTVSGLRVAFVGDLLNGRTVHSLVRLLALYGVHVHLVAPPGLELPEYVLADAEAGARRHNGQGFLSVQHHGSVDEVISLVDVVYATRLQRERFAATDTEQGAAQLREAHAEYLARCAITPARIAQAKDNMIVMHPLPRVDEIDPRVDLDPRAAYFRQMRYGLYVRMALLRLVLLGQ